MQDPQKLRNAHCWKTARQPVSSQGTIGEDNADYRQSSEAMLSSVALLRSKLEMYEKVQQYVSLIQNQFSRKPMAFLTDGEHEDLKGPTKAFCQGDCICAPEMMG